jgi:hypothetical protein
MVAASFVEMLMALFFVRREFRNRLSPMDLAPIVELPEAT